MEDGARKLPALIPLKRFCCLYTNLANPTSNRIYQAIGYEPIGDVVDYDIVG